MLGVDSAVRHGRGPLRRIDRTALRHDARGGPRPMTSPPLGPIEWVAITFPGTTLGAAAFTKLGELRERGLLTEAEFAQQKARLLG
jgi:hypothetical protein